jgi:hypothetical protein
MSVTIWQSDGAMLKGDEGRQQPAASDQRDKVPVRQRRAGFVVR